MLRIGDRVTLLGLPDWLVHDLPVDEQREMRGFVGQIAEITDIDAHGHAWLGFGHTVEDGDDAHYSGHSFCVPLEFLQQK